MSRFLLKMGTGALTLTALAGCQPGGSSGAAEATRARSEVAAYVPSMARFDLPPDGRGEAPVSFQFGAAYGVPVAGDWDGDGFDSVGIFFSGQGQFFLTNENAGGFAEIALSFGVFPGKVHPVAGDWHGTGKMMVGVYQPEEGRFLLRSGRSEASPVEEVRFGPKKRSLLPVAGDWDGDGRTDVGVYDPDAAVFTLSVNGQETARPFGSRGGVPLAGDWLGTGRWDVGILDRRAGEVLLRLKASETKRLPFRSPVAIPLVGRWHR